MDPRPPLPQRLLWVVRALWATLPLTVSPLVADAFDRRSAAVHAVLAVGAWALWFGGLIALFVPRVVTLVPARCLAPLPLVLTLWAGLDGELAGAFVLALVPSVAVAALVLSAPVGDAFVDGSSYGDERRFLLRVPGALLLGPIPLAWAVLVAGTVTGPLLLAAERYVIGALALVAGAALAAACFRALAALGQRWLVLVPAGAVLRDHLALAEPTLFPRASIAAIGPAPADAAGLDLRSSALGLAVVLQFNQPMSVTPTPRRGVLAEPCEITACSIAPARPGAAVAEAHRRNIGLR